MGLFDAFKNRSRYTHPLFGELQGVRGRWRGLIELEPGRPIVLFLPGPRSGPDADALRLAERSPAWWTAARPQIAAELFEHYEAGREAGFKLIPALSRASDVWPHVTLSSVEITPFHDRRASRHASGLG